MLAFCAFSLACHQFVVKFSCSVGSWCLIVINVMKEERQGKSDGHITSYCTSLLVQATAAACCGALTAVDPRVAVAVVCIRMSQRCYFLMASVLLSWIVPRCVVNRMKLWRTGRNCCSYCCTIGFETGIKKEYISQTVSPPSFFDCCLFTVIRSLTL